MKEPIHFRKGQLVHDADDVPCFIQHGTWLIDRNTNAPMEQWYWVRYVDGRELRRLASSLRAAPSTLGALE